MQDRIFTELNFQSDLFLVFFPRVSSFFGPKNSSFFSRVFLKSCKIIVFFSRVLVKSAAGGIF